MVYQLAINTYMSGPLEHQDIIVRSSGYISRGVWIRWTGTVEWNDGMDWNGMEWPDAHLEDVVKHFQPVQSQLPEHKLYMYAENHAGTQQPSSVASTRSSLPSTKLTQPYWIEPRSHALWCA